MYDLLIIGGGPAGYAAALRTAQRGGKVLLVEKEKIGGTCLHRGCIPSKVLFQQARTVEECRHALASGLFNAEPCFDLTAIRRRQEEAVSKLYHGLQDLLRKRGIEVLKGRALLKGPGSVIVLGPEGEREYASKNILLASGSKEKVLNVPGAKNIRGAEEGLQLPQHPCRLTIVGAGITGLELASAYASFGFSVTILEKEKNILPALGDEEISKWLAFLFKRRGLKIFTGSTLERVEKLVKNEVETFRLVISFSGNEKVIETDSIINAAGREPCLDIFAAGSDIIKYSAAGIVVNERMETNVPGIFAAGDVTGSPMLAHLAYFEGAIAAENALGANEILDLRPVPFCLSSTPGVAWVGLTEKQAKEKIGVEPQVGRFPLGAIGAAVLKGGGEGFIKLIAGEDGVLLGMQVFGQDVETLIMEGTIAVRHGLTVKQLCETIHPHPTLNEAFWETCLLLKGLPLHG